MSWLYLALAIVTEVGATMSLRASEGLKKKIWLVPIISGYIIAFVFLSMALREGMALGVAYGIWVACGVALTAILARRLFREPLNLSMSFGILMIAAGVLMIELGAGAPY